MAKLHVGLDGVEHVSIPKYKLHFSFNFHHIQHAISLLLKPRHVQFPSNPTCNFIFFQNLRCPISSKSDSDRHAIWFGLESGCAQFPSNPTYIFTFFSNTICPIPSKHVLQFRFFRDPDMINSHQIRHTMSSFFDIQTCPIYIKPDMQFRFFGNVEMSNFQSINCNFAFFCNPNMLNFQQTRHSISLFWNPDNPTCNVESTSGASFLPRPANFASFMF